LGFILFSLILLLVNSLPIEKNLTNFNRNLRYDKSQFIIEEKEIEDIQSKLKEYLSNSDKFIINHSNKDNFITIFSNVTQVNGEFLFNQFAEENKAKTLQKTIDEINNIKAKNNDKWTFNSLTNRFDLPEEMKTYSDYYKWKIIQGILRTMDKFPIKKSDSFNKNKHFLLPEDIKILSPPI